MTKSVSSVQSLSRVLLFVTPRITACQASLSITNSRSSPKLTSIKSVMPSHPLLSPSPPAFDLSQNQGLFERVSSSHQVAKVLEYSPSQMPANCFWASLAWMGLLLTNTSYSIISTLLSSPPTLHHPKYC